MEKYVDSPERIEILHNISVNPINNQTYFRMYENLFREVIFSVQEMYNKPVELITKTEWIAYLRTGVFFSLSTLSKMRIMYDQYLYDLEQAGIIMKNRFRNPLKMIKISDITRANKYAKFYYKDEFEMCEFIKVFRTFSQIGTKELFNCIGAFGVLTYRGIVPEEIYHLSTRDIDFSAKTITVPTRTETQDKVIRCSDEELEIIRDSMYLDQFDQNEPIHWFREYFSESEKKKFKTVIYNVIKNTNAALEELTVANKWSGKQFSFTYLKLSGDYHNILTTVAEKEGFDLDNLQQSIRSFMRYNNEYLYLYNSMSKKYDFLSWTDYYYPALSN